jgi:hypothetical protein
VLLRIGYPLPDKRITEDFLGFGLGLRTDHFEHILQYQSDIDWFEILSENYLVAGGKPRYYLEAIAEQYPIIFAGHQSTASTATIYCPYLIPKRPSIMSSSVFAVLKFWLIARSC